MMSAQTRTRYPGAQPFSDDPVSRKLFYGREQESSALTYQILANRLVVLFARSGVGKTSLLNAGVADQLRAEHYLPLSVRANDIDQGPLVSIYRGIEQACRRQSVEYVPGDETSLWHFFKSAQFWENDILLTPALILDQFEELFTLHTEQRRGPFLDQFSNLVRGVRPREITQQPAQSGEPGPSYSDAAPAVRIIVSLREDFLAQLEEISDRIPEILDQRFRLLPFGREAATRALDSPARIEDPSLATRPFQIDPQAQAAILDFLERRTATPGTRSARNIEPFQLQLICQRVEEIAHKAQLKDMEHVIALGMADIGGESTLRQILRGFYKRQVAAVPSLLQRRRARKLCSEFLINPSGRRLRMEESEIQRLTHVRPRTLQILVDRRLLRRDRSIEGDYYELSHDSLVIPVVDSVRRRFLTRAAFSSVGGIVACFFALGLIVGMAALAIMALVGSERLAEFAIEMLLIVLGVAILWPYGCWGFRNLRRSREMWRRFRI